MSTILPHMVWPQYEFRMQVWNVQHTARWKCRIQKSPKIRHLRTIAQLCQPTCPHNMVNFGLLTAEIRSGVWGMHPSKFQRVSRLGSVTARHSSSGRQPNFGALNRGCHLYSAGRPSRWALAHILVVNMFWTAIAVYSVQFGQSRRCKTTFSRVQTLHDIV